MSTWKEVINSSDTNDSSIAVKQNGESGEKGEVKQSCESNEADVVPICPALKFFFLFLSNVLFRCVLCGWFSM